MHHPGRKDKKDDCLNIQKMSIKYSAGRVQRISGVKKNKIKIKVVSAENPAYRNVFKLCKNLYLNMLIEIR